MGHTPTAGDGTAANPVVRRVITFVTVATIWVAFGGAPLLSAGTLHDVWAWVRDLPCAPRIATWIVCLPWMLGLATWHAAWPAALRLVAIAGPAVATLGLFFPRGR